VSKAVVDSWLLVVDLFRQIIGTFLGIHHHTIANIHPTDDGMQKSDAHI
jgi:hypothetical protein